jgi:IS4 transposase
VGFANIDKGYIDFDRFAHWIGQGVFFVTWVKSNMAYRVVENRPVPRHVGRKMEFRGRVRSDKTIELTDRESSRKCPHQLRQVKYYDAVSKRTFTFLTNNVRLSAQTVADLDNARWFVELFFKDLKQNLTFKSFYGTSQNAVTIQLCQALHNWIYVKEKLVLS